MSVTASAIGKLDAWIDFNRDGDWEDDGEQIFNSENVVAGSQLISYTVPDGASSGDSFARFRLSTAGGLQPTGEAADGEVEDYKLSILDGDVAGGVDVRINPSSTGTLDVSAEGADLVIRSGAIEVFRSPGSSIKSIDISGTTEDDTINLANIDAIFGGSITGDAGDGNDRLNLTDADQELDLTILAEGTLRSIETFDIRGTDNNRLSLRAADVIGLANAGNEVTILLNPNDTLDTNNDGFTITAIEVVDNMLQVVATSGSATLKIRGTNWTNPLDRFDVNASGNVSPLDALVILNQLVRRDALVGSTSTLVDPTSLNPLPDKFYDVTGEGILTPLDALRILNFLNRGAASGEAAVSAAPLPSYASGADDHDDDELPQAEPETLTPE